MSNFWAKFYEPLPSAPLKPNNASAIFGGQAPYGLRAAEPSIFRPKDPTPNRPAKTRKKVSRSHSDVGISKSSEKRKSREIVIKRKVSESSRIVENSSGKNNAPVSLQKDTEKDTSSGDSPDGETNGDRYPLFISVKKPSEVKFRKSTNNENHCNGSPARRGSDSASPKSASKSSKVTLVSGSPFDSLRREKTDFIIRPRKSPGETGNPVTAFKREKSDITLKRSHSPSGKVKPRGSGSPASIRREKSDITLKRSQPPANLTREKSDLVRPRGSASPGPLRREKSDITAKSSRSPSSGTTSVKPKASDSPGRIRREKSDLTSSSLRSPSGTLKEKVDFVKRRGPTSPGSLKREKSDVSKKPPVSPSKSSLPKPRVSASVGASTPDKAKTSSKDLQPSSIAESEKNLQTCTTEQPRHDTKSESHASKDKGEGLNQAVCCKTLESGKSAEKSEPVKKPPNSPSKSSLPKPRVYASASIGKPDRSDNLSKELHPSKTSTDKKSPPCTSPRPIVQNTKSVLDAVKSKNELKHPVSSTTVESPKQEICDFASSEQSKNSASDQFHKESFKQENYNTINTSSSEDNTEVIQPHNCISAGVETDQRVSSPDSSKDCGLNRTTSPVSRSQTVCSDISNSNPAIMSKIPTPTTSTPVSKIPSLTKASTPPSKIPPKSKIPSFSKKSEEEPKTTNITSGIPTISDKPASKIPGLQRADPAKENKDPALNGDKIEEGNNQNSKVSRIPAVTKTSTPAVSKIPSMTWQESPGSQITETVETPKTRIPSISSSEPNTSTPVSKIPSFTNKHNLAKTSSKEEPESKIPHLTTSTTTPNVTGLSKPEVTLTAIPNPENKSATTESRIPQLQSPPSKLTGIPKPEIVASGIPKPETPTTPTESKIPQFSTPRSKIPAPAGSVLTRKDSDEKIKKPKIEESPKKGETLDDEESHKAEETRNLEEPNTKASPSAAKVPPPPPPRQDVSSEESKANLDLSMNEDIFTEAKRMEELLRNESIVVEVPTKETDSPSETIGKSEVSKTNYEKEPNVELMVTESVETKDLGNNKKETLVNEKKKDQFSFKTFGKKEDQVTVSHTSEKSSSKTLSLGLKKEEEKSEETKESTSDEIGSPQESKETPAIDTLGQYEQQSRRSRSRQRKIISPDSDEASKTFEQTDADDAENKTLDKELLSKAEDAETKAKVTKTKVKHDKPKFVIESSLGADFYQSKSSQPKDTIAVDAKNTEAVVIQNKSFDDTKGIPKTDVKKSEKVETVPNKDSAVFEDVEVSSNRESKVEMKAWSMEELDEKTVKCSCGRGGKCSIM